MNRLAQSGMILLCAGALTAGCAPHGNGGSPALLDSASVVRSADRESATEVRPDRLLVWKASLTLDVASVEDAMSKAISIAEQFKGYVEQKSYSSETSASVRLRVPADAFKNAVGALEQVGTITYRTVAGEDVTERYVDTEARVKNKIELRDRLRQLLHKATEVKDILAIETELNRVQSDIDAMEGKLRLLKSQVAYATVDVSFHREKVLGPLGYMLKGLWWGIEKLFVLRD
jgi:Domain of unknown function (DUF4349)